MSHSKLLITEPHSPTPQIRRTYYSLGKTRVSPAYSKECLNKRLEARLEKENYNPSARKCIWLQLAANLNSSSGSAGHSETVRLQTQFAATPMSVEYLLPGMTKLILVIKKVKLPSNRSFVALRNQGPACL